MRKSQSQIMMPAKQSQPNQHLGIVDSNIMMPAKSVIYPSQPALVEQQLLQQAQQFQLQTQPPHQDQIIEEQEEDSDQNNHHHPAPPHLIKEYVLEEYESLVYVSDQKSEQFSDIKIFRMHPFSKYLASKKIQFSKVIDYDQRTSLRNPHIAYSLGYITKLQESISIFFEYNFQSLFYLIQKRKAALKYIPENEILALCKGITYALKQLQELNIAHGQIDSKNVFFDIDYFLYRIYDNELLNGCFSGYFKMLKHQEDQTFLAPELLSIFGQNPLTLIEPYKCDVFSLGMLLLECSTLQSSLDCYDFPRKTLKTDVINQRLFFVAKNYSPHFVKFIQMCLEPVPSQRPDWNHISLCLMDENLFKSNVDCQINFVIKLSESSSNQEQLQFNQIAPQLEIPYTDFSDSHQFLQRSNRHKTHNEIPTHHHSTSPRIFDQRSKQIQQKEQHQTTHSPNNLYKSYLFETNNSNKPLSQLELQQTYSGSKAQSNSKSQGKKNKANKKVQANKVATKYQNENVNYPQYQTTQQKEKENNLSLQQQQMKFINQVKGNNTPSLPVPLPLQNSNNIAVNNNNSSNLNANNTPPTHHNTSANFLQQKLVSLNRLITDCLQQQQQVKTLH